MNGLGLEAVLILSIPDKEWLGQEPLVPHEVAVASKNWAAHGTLEHQGREEL